MVKPTPFEVELGRTIRSRFGQTTKVLRFADDQEEHSVLIVSGADCPAQGVTSYGTVGLYGNPQRADQDEVAVEIVMACATATPHVDNLIASCVFDSFQNGSDVAYGSCMRGLLDQYRVSRSLRHVTFVAPFLWEGLNRIVVGDAAVYCLMAIAISDAEASYLDAYGIDALERLLDHKQIDLFDIDRPSVI